MKQKSVFRKILISYLIIMLTPMIILGYCIFSFFYRFYDSELLNNRIASVQKMQVTFDMLIRGLNANAYSMLTSPEFSTSHLSNSYGNFYDVTGRLSNFAFTNDFISDTFYVNGDLQLIYTAETAYRFSDFYVYGKGYNVPQQEISELLLKNARMYWLPAQNVGKAYQQHSLSYIVTNKAPAGSGQKMSILFQIKSDNLNQIAGDFITNVNSCVIISDLSDKLLYSSNAQVSDVAWDIWRNYNKKETDVPVTIFVNNEKYIVFQKYSTVTPIKYSVIIPHQTIVAPIRQYYILFFISILSIVMIGSFFIFYFMRINYAPIKSLGKLAAIFFNEPTGNLDELQATEKALVEMSQSNQNLMKDKITFKLIKGEYQSLEAFEVERGRAKYVLAGPKFRVMSFCISGEPPNHVDFAELIEKEMSFYTDVAIVESSKDDVLFLVVSGKPEEIAALDEKLSEIKTLVETHLSISLALGVGKVVDIYKITESYAQANAASKYQIVKGRSSIIYYQNMKRETGAPFTHHTYLLEALHNAILLGRKEKIQMAMDVLIKQISVMNNLFFATCLAYDIVNTVLKAMREMNISLHKLNQHYIISQGTLKSTEEIVQIVNLLTQDVFEAISLKENNHQAKEENSLDTIMSYIEKHYHEENISVKLLADYFGMSVSNFSHYFKNQTGQTISDYIAMLRFEKSKELLRTTDINLQDIAVLCGYLHLSTFMRQFKKRENITPAGYRASMQEKRMSD